MLTSDKYRGSIVLRNIQPETVFLKVHKLVIIEKVQISQAR